MSPSGAARHYGRIPSKRLIDHNGREMPGHLDDSAGETRPAVVVVHDFFGLTETIKHVTRRLAAEGYVVFAPDLYRGQVATTRDEAIALAKTIAWNRVATELGLVVN